jgi:AcrR family transcriptional regulator
MKPKAEDRRIQRTRQLLQHALLELILERGYEAITVQDVIDRANVGRSTFYAHFQDKEDLFLSEFEALRDEFEQHLIREEFEEQKPWDLSLKMFEHAQRQRELYRALASSQGGSSMLVHMNRFLYSLLCEHLKPAYSRRGADIPVPLDVLAHFLVSSFLGLLSWWLDHDMPYPPAQINAMYRQLIQPGVEGLLR